MTATLPPLMRRAGFTLIELVIVIAIIAVIVAAVFVAMDPVMRLNRAHNARRFQDVTAIAEAIQISWIDYLTGGYPVGVPLPLSELPLFPSTGGKYLRIGQDLPGYGGDFAPPCTNACGPIGQSVAPRGCIDPAIVHSTVGELSELPRDPATGHTADYAVLIETGGLIRVRACVSSPEGPGGEGAAPLIEVAR